MAETDELRRDAVETSIEFEGDGGAWVLTFHGEHDLSTHLALRAQLGRAYELGGPLVVDLSRATFVDSTVLGVIVASYKERAVDAAPVALVVADNYPGTRLVELIGVGSVIPTYPTRAAAVRALTGASS
jgi:anti-sigma B factor antagonist